jgi:hypothetical protein
LVEGPALSLVEGPSFVGAFLTFALERVPRLLPVTRRGVDFLGALALRAVGRFFGADDLFFATFLDAFFFGAFPLREAFLAMLVGVLSDLTERP